MAKAWKQNTKKGRNLTNFALSRLVPTSQQLNISKTILSDPFLISHHERRPSSNLRCDTKHCDGNIEPANQFATQIPPSSKNLSPSCPKRKKKTRNAADPAIRRPQRAPKRLGAPWRPVLHEATWRKNLDAVKRVIGHGWRAEIWDINGCTTFRLTEDHEARQVTE